jgi:ABC-type sugar transport system ATPase subunit
VYDRPATTFVAQFIGSPPMNLIQLDAGALGVRLAPPPRAAVVGLRPQDVRLNAGDGFLPGTVQLVESLGSAQIVHVRVDAARMLAVAPPQPVFAPGAHVKISADHERLHFFDGDGRRL